MLGSALHTTPFYSFTPSLAVNAAHRGWAAHLGQVKRSCLVCPGLGCMTGRGGAGRQLQVSSNPDDEQHQTHVILKSVNHLHCLGQNNLLLIVFSKQCWWGVLVLIHLPLICMFQTKKTNCWVDLHKVLPPPCHLACRYPPAANSSPPMCRYKYVTVEYKINENLWKPWVSCATCAGK